MIFYNPKHLGIVFTNITFRRAAMKLSEFYAQIGADYATMLERMLYNESLVYKFLQRFLTDKTFYNLESVVASGSVDDVFRAAHTLKGVTANLELAPLLESVSELVEHTRKGGNCELIPEMFERIKSDYNLIISLIKEIDQN